MLKHKTISKSKLWQKMFDDYRLRYNYLSKSINYKEHVSYKMLELDYNLKILLYTILNELRIIKLED